MNEVLERRFATMGARLSLPERPWRGAPRIDVARNGFDIRFSGSGSEVDVEVVDVRPQERHLLLLVRDGDEKSKFLCGHDERHWFVAAITETARGVHRVPGSSNGRAPGSEPGDRGSTPCPGAHTRG